MTFQLSEPTYTDADREHDEAHDPSPTARVIALSHVSICVGDLLTAGKMLQQAQGFEAIQVLEQAKEHLEHAVSQLTGKVWQL